MKASVILAALLAASTAHAAPAELREAAMKIHEAHRDAVVWISVIAKTSMSVDGDAPEQIKAQLAGQERETTNETTATFISKDGLLVAALPQLDQSSVVDGRTIQTPMGPVKIKSESQIQEIQVIMPDGTEVPADLVLKDPDLGLAFIRVRMDSEEADGLEIHAIDLTQSAEGTMLDDCIGLGRLDENFNRDPSVITSEITGITKRPRTFYRVMTDSVGCPIFLSNGKLLGITVVRKPSGDIQGNNVQLSPAVLPAADIAKVAEQAKTAQPEKPAAEESAEGEAGE
ncbi:MAG: serine protease [Akkermansiaceae bacterium]|jgi:hypothetical protein|nr:serine protease [Akkermansiaceae bacterium]